MSTDPFHHLCRHATNSFCCVAWGTHIPMISYDYFGECIENDDFALSESTQTVYARQPKWSCEQRELCFFLETSQASGIRLIQFFEIVFTLGSVIREGSKCIRGCFKDRVGRVPIGQISVDSGCSRRAFMFCLVCLKHLPLLNT